MAGMNEHTHQWRTRYITRDFVDFASGMQCDCGETLHQDQVEEIVNAQSKTWCVRDASDTWHLVTGITGAMADPYVALTACGKAQGVAEQSRGALRVADCKECIQA